MKIKEDENEAIEFLDGEMKKDKSEEGKEQ